MSVPDDDELFGRPEPARLPGRARRRAELLTLIDDRRAAARSRFGLRPRVLVPALTVAAVAGVAVAVPAITPEHRQRPPAASAAGAGLPGGQRPDEGVPLEQARPGDPVPWDIAARLLEGCMRNGRETALRSAGRPATDHAAPAPPQVTPGTVGPVAPPVTPGAAGLSMDGPRSTGAEVTPPGIVTAVPTPYPTPDTEGRWGPMGWVQPEEDDAYRPYFTAWTWAPNGSLTPLVVGKALGPGIIACTGSRPEAAFAITGEHIAPGVTNNDGWLQDAIDLHYSQVRDGLIPGPPAAPSAAQAWGRAAPFVSRVTVEYPNGHVTEAVVRNGMWFAHTDKADLGEVDPRLGVKPAHVTAFDAQGSVVARDPSNGELERQWIDRGAAAVCYRTPDGVLLSRKVELPMPDPATCAVAAGRWNGTAPLT